MPDGGVQLEVPYSHSQEIMMDILRHGHHVEVIQPAKLRNEVAEAHRRAAEQYKIEKREAASEPAAQRDQVRRLK